MRQAEHSRRSHGAMVRRRSIAAKRLIKDEQHYWKADLSGRAPILLAGSTVKAQASGAEAAGSNLSFGLELGPLTAAGTGMHNT